MEERRATTTDAADAMDGDGGHQAMHDHAHHHGDDERDGGGGLVAWIRELYGTHSHDSADSLDSALESSAAGIRAVKVSLAGLMTTAVLQVLVVALTGSIALLADTIHNFSDALTSIPLWIAFVIGRRLATRSHTYGYRRAEDLSGLFIVAMIALSAAVAAWESVRRLVDPTDIDNVGLLALAGVIGFIGNEAVAVYRIRVGTRIGSAALVADGHHARTDGLTSLAVVVGAAGAWLGYPIVDPVVGLLITVAILFVLRDAGRQVFRRLMDAVDPAIPATVERAARDVEDVRDVRAVRARWVGHRLTATLDVAVDPTLTVAEGHAIAEQVRHALFHELAALELVTVHVDPDGPDDHHDRTRHHMQRLADTGDAADDAGTG